MAKEVAIAPSTASPPAASTSAPACAASRCWAATMPYSVSMTVLVVVAVRDKFTDMSRRLRIVHRALRVVQVALHTPARGLDGARRGSLAQLRRHRTARMEMTARGRVDGVGIGHA